MRLADAPSLGWPELAPAALYLGVLLLTWLELRLSRYSGSPAVPALALTLLGIGIAVQYRIGTFRKGRILSKTLYRVMSRKGDN